MKTHLSDKKVEVPSSVTIDCLELLEFTARKNVVQSSEMIGETYHISVEGYEKGYSVVAEFAAVPYDAEYLDGDRGSEMVSSGGVANELTEVLEVTDYEGNEILLDHYTGKELLNLLIID